MDKHYTPKSLADQLVAKIGKRPKLVADFSAGEGALLTAARSRWPNCRVIATDLDRRAVKQLSTLRSSKTSLCDFLSARSRSACKALKSMGAKLDVIVLNPPFSCRGSSFHSVQLFDASINCSTAMAFLITATRYLHPRGQIGAILPASCMTSDKDRAAREALASRYRLDWQTFDSDRSFPGCEVAVVFALLRPGSGEQRAPTKRALAVVDREEIHASLFRGNFPMDKAKTLLNKRGRKLIHSTGLMNNGVEHTHRISINRSIVEGPAILLPRVGRFNADKVSLKLSPETVAISDCVIGLQTSSEQSLLSLHKRIKAWAGYIGATYEGSCAKYTTLSKLKAVLKNINVSVEITKIGIQANLRSTASSNARKNNSGVHGAQRASAR